MDYVVISSDVRCDLQKLLFPTTHKHSENSKNKTSQVIQTKALFAIEGTKETVVLLLNVLALPSTWPPIYKLALINFTNN